MLGDKGDQTLSRTMFALTHTTHFPSLSKLNFWYFSLCLLLLAPFLGTTRKMWLNSLKIFLKGIRGMCFYKL